MIDAAAFKAIIDLYAKHGWKLRRVLLSDTMKNSPAVGVIPPEVDVRESELDAAWFSRSSQPGQTAWEIRHLSPAPFALVEVIGDGTADTAANEVLEAAEAKMLSIANKRPQNA